MTSVTPPRRIFDRYLVANLILWVFTYLLITVRSLGMDETRARLIDMGLRRAAICCTAVVACVAIQKALLATRDWPRGQRIALAVALSLAGAVFYTGLNHAAFYLIAPVGKSMPWSQTLIGLVMNLSVLIWSFIAWSAIVLAMSFDEEARENTLRLVEAQALAAESQNQMLRYQINPHFLFNTLNALSSLILQRDVDRAERMVLSLSSFLRASLERAPGEKITLADEIAAQRQYLAIERERFGDRLVLSETLPPDLAGALVPSLILQPLVENAVKYGVARTRRPVRIEIVASAEDGRLSVDVLDDAAPDLAEAVPALGVGLENVRRRLALAYGEAGRLSAGPRAEGGFRAAIELPLERA